MHAFMHAWSCYQVAADAAYLAGTGMSSNYANGEVIRYPASGATRTA